ncbi:MAG: glycosyltransferase [Acidobacteriia bacterium]|nr:glycosyltransferase [Terriglobia bacterium]
MRGSKIRQYQTSQIGNQMEQSSERASTKAILLAYYFPPDNTSGVQRAVRIAKYLPRYGVDISVIASSHAGTEGNPYAAQHVPTAELHAAGYQQWFARLVQRVVPYNEQLDWVPHALQAARRLIEKEQITAVISTSPPIGTHIAAGYLKARYGLRWIADFRDPLIGNPNRARGWAKAYDVALERGIFNGADALVAVTDAVLEEWQARYPKWRSKMHLIWNGFDPEDSLGPLPIPPRDARVLAHIGVLYPQRHPYALLTGMDGLIRKGRLDPAKIRLCFLGPVHGREKLEQHEAAAALIEKGVLEIREELVPRKDANRVMATSDYLLLIDIVNLAQAAYTVPAKIYDYILMGRPILAVTGEGSPVERILTRSGVPHVCLYHGECCDVAEGKVARFFALPAEPVKPSEWFLESFDGERQAGKLAELVGI